MINKVLILGAALSVASVAVLTSSRPVSAVSPVPFGPGGVLNAVTDLRSAMDSGNSSELKSILIDSHRGVKFTLGADGEFDTTQNGEHGPMFIDCSFDGQRVTSERGAQFLEQLAKDCAKRTGSGWSVETRVVSVDADCPMAELSYAVVELERVFTKKGEASRVVPMRATVLLSHEGSRFRVWHWHASAAR